MTASDPRIQIVVDAKGNLQVLDRAEASIREVIRAKQALQKERLDAVTQAERQALQSQIQTLESTERAMRETARAKGELGTKTTGSNRALIEFSRIANDSQQFAYGFTQGLIAISNQADGLAQSLQQAGQQAGGFGAGIANIGKGLFTTFGGMVTLLNLVITLAVVFGDEIADAFRGAAEAADDAFLDIATSADGLKSAVKSATDAFVEFEGASGRLIITSKEQGEELIASARVVRDKYAAAIGEAQEKVEFLSRVHGVFSKSANEARARVDQLSARVTFYEGQIESLTESLREYNAEQEIFADFSERRPDLVRADDFEAAVERERESREKIQQQRRRQQERAAREAERDREREERARAAAAARGARVQARTDRAADQRARQRRAEAERQAQEVAEVNERRAALLLAIQTEGIALAADREIEAARQTARERLEIAGVTAQNIAAIEAARGDEAALAALTSAERQADLVRLIEAALAAETARIRIAADRTVADRRQALLRAVRDAELEAVQSVGTTQRQALQEQEDLVRARITAEAALAEQRSREDDRATHSAEELVTLATSQSVLDREALANLAAENDHVEGLVALALELLAIRASGAQITEREAEAAREAADAERDRARSAAARRRAVTRTVTRTDGRDGDVDEARQRLRETRADVEALDAELRRLQALAQEAAEDAADAAYRSGDAIVAAEAETTKAIEDLLVRRKEAHERQQDATLRLEEATAERIRDLLEERLAFAERLADAAIHAVRRVATEGRRISDEEAERNREDYEEAIRAEQEALRRREQDAEFTDQNIRRIEEDRAAFLKELEADRQGFFVRSARAISEAVAGALADEVAAYASAEIAKFAVARSTSAAATAATVAEMGTIAVAAAPAAAGVSIATGGAAALSGTSAVLLGLAAIVAAIGAASALGAFEAGGFIGREGERGRDTVPLVSATGRPVAVAARGEAIVNGHQQAVINDSLRRTHGLDLAGLFRGEARPHSTAPRSGTPRGTAPQTPLAQSLAATRRLTREVRGFAVGGFLPDIGAMASGAVSAHQAAEVARHLPPPPFPPEAARVIAEAVRSATEPLAREVARLKQAPPPVLIGDEATRALAERGAVVIADARPASRPSRSSIRRP